MAAGGQGLRPPARGRVRRVQQASLRRPLTLGARTLTGTVLAVALAAAGLSGCTVPGAPGVAVALPSADGRWGEVAEVLRDRIEAAGYAVDLRVAGDDIPTQVGQVEELLAEKPAALIVAPVDATSLTTVLDRAPAQLEVVAFGTLVRDTPAVDRLVAFDAAAEGAQQATALVEGLGLLAGGPFRIELFAGSIDDDGTAISFAAALSVLQPYLDAGRIVVGSGEAALDDATTLRGNAATAESRMARLLHDTYATTGGQAYPDAVLAPSDAIARGVADALAAAGAVPGEGYPVLTGRGTELRAVAALDDGRQYSTQLEDPGLLAAEAADRVIEALRTTATAIPDPSATPSGAVVDNEARLVPASLLQPQTVRASDVDELVVGSGYWTRAQVDRAIREYGLTPSASPTPSPTPTGSPSG